MTQRKHNILSPGSAVLELMISIAAINNRIHKSEAIGYARALYDLGVINDTDRDRINAKLKAVWTDTRSE